jgi:hypothetical protein
MRGLPQLKQQKTKETPQVTNQSKRVVRFCRWHDLPLFDVDIRTGKPTGFVNFVCEVNDVEVFAIL